MNEPLVSVLLPVKNGARFLAEALRSVVAQTYRPLEIVMIDARSTDGSVEIARSFAEVRILSQSETTGLANAWNMGLDAATGELIGFIGSDDLWSPEKLALQVDYLHRHLETEHVIALADFFREPGEPLPGGFRPELLQGAYPARMPEALLARKSLFQRLGRFDPNFQISPDVDWFTRMQDAQVETACIPQVLVHRRVHAHNLSFDERSALVSHELLDMLGASIKRKRAAAS